MNSLWHVIMKMEKSISPWYFAYAELSVIWMDFSVKSRFLSNWFSTHFSINLLRRGTHMHIKCPLSCFAASSTGAVCEAVIWTLQENLSPCSLSALFCHGHCSIFATLQQSGISKVHLWLSNNGIFSIAASQVCVIQLYFEQMLDFLNSESSI